MIPDGKELNNKRRMLQEIQPASIFCQCQWEIVNFFQFQSWLDGMCLYQKLGNLLNICPSSPWICPHPCVASCRTEAPAPENSAAPAPWSPEEPGTDIGWWPGPGVACELSVICHASNIQRIRIFSEDILTPRILIEDIWTVSGAE